MGNVSGRSCRENQNTHFLFSNIFFFENCTVSEIIWKSIIERGRPQMNACWIAKATNAHPRLCNTICVYTATMVARTRLNVTLYVHCLSCPYLLLAIFDCFVVCEYVKGLYETQCVVKLRPMLLVFAFNHYILLHMGTRFTPLVSI